jgi:hypothetical protein
MSNGAPILKGTGRAPSSTEPASCDVAQILRAGKERFNGYQENGDRI